MYKRDGVPGQMSDVISDAAAILVANGLSPVISMASVHGCPDIVYCCDCKAAYERSVVALVHNEIIINANCPQGHPIFKDKELADMLKAKYNG